TTSLCGRIFFRRLPSLRSTTENQRSIPKEARLKASYQRLRNLLLMSSPSYSPKVRRLRNQREKPFIHECLRSWGFRKNSSNEELEEFPTPFSLASYCARKDGIAAFTMRR